MKQALCVVGNQATPVTGEVCGDNDRKVSAHPLPQPLPKFSLPLAGQLGLSGPSNEACSRHSPADSTLAQ